jgi:TolB-like protein
LIVVVPLDWMTGRDRVPALGRAMQSVVEADLRANGVAVRTEDDLDSTHWGKIEGAKYLLTGSVISLGSARSLQIRLVGISNPMDVAAVKLRDLSDRRNVTKMVLHALKKPAPESISQLDVSEELLTAWGEALEALHDGKPDDAHQRVAAVAAKWPAFTPARERLAQLEK